MRSIFEICPKKAKLEVKFGNLNFVGGWFLLKDDRHCFTQVNALTTVSDSDIYFQLSRFSIYNRTVPEFTPSTGTLSDSSIDFKNSGLTHL